MGNDAIRFPRVFAGTPRIAGLAGTVLILACGTPSARAATLRAGPARVDIAGDGILHDLVFENDRAAVPELIPWQAVWDGGRNNEAPDRRTGPRLRCNAEGVSVSITAAEGGTVAFLDFDHPDIRVLMRLELAERHLDLIPYRVTNRREDRLCGLEVPAAAYHPVSDNCEYVGVAWGGLALRAATLRQGASYKSECPQATHDLALMLDRPLSLATFSVQPLAQVPFRRTRFGPVGDRAAEKGWSGLSHEVAMWAARGQTEALPPVRLAVGADAADIFDAYREANGMNAWPDLRDKMGKKTDTLAACVHLKYDLNHFAQLFEGDDELAFLRELPEGPYLWEMVCYHGRLGLHDTDYPDFTTFAEAHGGERMFKQRVGVMKHRGDLVSVYANPFWWQGDSAGMRALGGPEAIAVRKRDGSLYDAFYGNKHGYYIGAWRQPVLDQEVARLTSLRDDQGLDMVFQDTYGTRGEYDFAADFFWPPYGYAQALVEMAGHSSGVLPVSGEGVGLDRTFRYLTASMGFYLTTMNGSRSVFYDNQHRAGTTRQWPVGALILRDKVAFYPHNLAVGILTSENLSWAVAAGMNMHYRVRDVLVDPDNGANRLKALVHVQNTVCRPVFGQRLAGFEFLDRPYEITRTAYANGYAVYAPGSAAGCPAAPPQIR
ncbi:MAG: hypothetical protein JW951_05840, partial [Lentisphaerae bacterium]|nr:hypothetical protein [Lentisphaerota bacterium]